MTHEEEIDVLKKIVKNMYDKMNINIRFYESHLLHGTPNIDELKQYLHSCNSINMARIDDCIGRIKEIKK